MATYDWTISIIAQVDNHPEVKEKYDKFLNVIKSVPPNTRIKYILLEYRNEPGTGPAIVFKKLVKTAPGEDFKEDLPLPASNDLYQKQTLIDFFNLHVLNETSDRHMLITWGHGAGLGFFTERFKSHIKNLLDTKGLLNIKGLNKEVDSFLEYAAWEMKLRANGYNKKAKLPMNESLKGFFEKTFSTKNNFLVSFLAEAMDPVFEARYIPIDDFADAMHQSFGVRKIKIDLMFTLSCYMQMMETGFTLRERVEILVAPVSAIPFKGINFRHLFHSFNTLPATDPRLQPAAIAASIVEKYPLLYKDDVNFRKFNYRLSANYPGKYEDILKGIDTFCEFYFTRRSRLFNSSNTGNLMAEEYIRTIRGTCDDQTTGDQNHFIPVGEFFNKLQTQFGNLDPLESNLVKNARSIYEQAFDSIFASFPEKNSSSTIKNNLPFVTIFFPDKKNSDENFVAYFLSTIFHDDQSVFTGHTHWDRFVRTYVEPL